MTVGLLYADWPAPPAVGACATTRRGGVSQGPYAGLNLGNGGDEAAHRVRENRARLRAALELEAVCWLRQVHGTDVHVVPASGPLGEPPRADAVVSARPGVACAVLVADCLPVLFATRGGDRIGAAHAGWRGLAAGVLEATLDALGVPPQQVLAWLGPAIGPAAFEVGEEVRAAFLERCATAAPRAALERAFSRRADGRLGADLAHLARVRLEAAGVGWVGGRGPDVYAEAGRFYSHRRDGGVTGRQAALVWLRRPHSSR